MLCHAVYKKAPLSVVQRMVQDGGANPAYWGNSPFSTLNLAATSSTGDVVAYLLRQGAKPQPTENICSFALTSGNFDALLALASRGQWPPSAEQKRFTSDIWQYSRVLWHWGKTLSVSVGDYAVNLGIPSSMGPYDDMIESLESSRAWTDLQQKACVLDTLRLARQSHKAPELAQRVYQRYQKGLPALIAGGWDEHSVYYLLHRGLLFQANRGAGAENAPTIQVYEMDVTLDKLKVLMGLHDMPRQRSLTHFEELKGKPVDLLWNWRQFKQSLQKENNCRWVSLKTSLLPLLMVSKLEPTEDPRSGLNEASFKESRCFYLQWVKLDRYVLFRDFWSQASTSGRARAKPLVSKAKRKNSDYWSATQASYFSQLS